MSARPGKLLLWGLGAIAVVGLGWSLLGELGLGRTDQPSRLGLIEGLAVERLVEGRLSWDIPYVPWHEAPSRSSRTVVRGTFAVEAAVRGGSSAKALGERAIIQLARGRTAAAVQDLEAAVALEPRNAALWSDLAAVHLARAGEPQGGPRHLALALEAAERAAAADPFLLQAIFNQALARERLFLLDDARAAWERYLDLDSDSGWAAEARAHLRDLTRQSTAQIWKGQREQLQKAAARGDDQILKTTATRFPQEVRSFVEDDLLGAWAEAVLGRRPEDAARALAMAERIASVLARTAGEHLPEDAVAVVEAAAADPARLAALAEGHWAYREARGLYAKRDIAAAGQAFDHARRILAKQGSPVADWATLYLAVGHYEGFELAQAIADMEELVRRVPARYPSLLGRTLWSLGLVRLVNGEPLASLAAYRRSVTALERSGTVEDTANVQALIAENLLYLGEERENWEYLYWALRSTPRIGVARRLHVIYAESAEACLAANWKAAARLFREAEARIAVAAGEPVGASHALIEKSAILAALGEREEAIAVLAEAHYYLDQIQDPNLRDRVEADLRISESELSIADPVSAETGLTKAIAFYIAKGSHYPLSALYLARARARLAADDENGAEADLRAGIEEFELQRGRVPEERLQISFFDRARGLFEEMVLLQAVRRGRADTSLYWAERRRARVLLDRLGTWLSLDERRLFAVKAGESLTAAEIQRGLPPGVAIVEYATLSDRLLTWVVRADGVWMEDQPVGAAELGERVEGFLAAASRGERLSWTATNLHDLLIRPVLSRLHPEDTIIFVPDGVLHAVPFVALIDRSTQRYLVQDRVTTVAPSATLGLESLWRSRRVTLAEKGRALVVANPRFDRGATPNLPDLVWAEREAEEIAAILPSKLLIGAEATRPRFLAEAGKHEVIHFGVHAVVNQEYPLLSYLLLASDGEADPGALYAHQIYGRRFDRTRLVVLAACNTARGRTTGEGSLSIGRAFLAAGVPAVVASLWDVDDHASVPLFRAFYSRLRAGDDPAAALRNAQLAALESVDSSLRNPAGWAGFQFLGGSIPPKLSSGR